MELSTAPIYVAISPVVAPVNVPVEILSRSPLLVSLLKYVEMLKTYETIVFTPFSTSLSAVSAFWRSITTLSNICFSAVNFAFASLTFRLVSLDSLSYDNPSILLIALL